VSSALREYVRQLAGVERREVRRTHSEVSSWSGSAGRDLAKSNGLVQAWTVLRDDLDSGPGVEFGRILIATTHDKHPFDVLDGEKPANCVVKH
jgi:hypothetical protein